MKKMFFAIALLCLCTIFAQAQGTNGITIKNSTPCRIYLVLHGAQPSDPSCSSNYRSGIVAVNAGTTINFNDPSTVPGGMTDPMNNQLGSNGLFSIAIIFENNPVTCSAPQDYPAGLCIGTSTIGNVQIKNSNTCTACNGNTYSIYTTQTGPNTQQIEIH
ncbi:MAG: hypothetical protein R2800_08280 [Flavipsychrobacter sp.]